MTGNPVAPLLARDGRIALWGLGATSALSNILLLAGPVYMLQVYDRVLVSGSVPTLVALTVLVAFLYLIYGFVEVLRQRMASRVGSRFEARTRGDAFEATLRLASRRQSSGADVLGDVDTIRGFFAGQGPLALLDLPWVPIYLALVFLLHGTLGLVATAGAVIVVAILVLTELTTSRVNGEVTALQYRRRAAAATMARDADSLIAMGATSPAKHWWSAISRKHANAAQSATDLNAGFSSAGRSFRLLLQSIVLGAGAWLVIDFQVTPGTMIAASIITSRALAPVEQTVGHWRQLSAARASYRRFRATSAALTNDALDLYPLPRPRHSVSAEGLTTSVPGMHLRPTRSLDLEIRAGEGLGIVGPSGSGKSVLLRTLAGIWPPGAGTVRFDGSEAVKYQEHAGVVGYLPQQVSGAQGTVAEYISRFGPTDGDVIKAAKVAGAHELITSLPEGYDTRLEDDGPLSAGQMQRVALARALFGDPFMVFLDEPNSNLDHAGELALNEALADVRSRGGIVVVVAHRPVAIESVNKLLLLLPGGTYSFGSKGSVLETIRKASSRRSEAS